MSIYRIFIVGWLLMMSSIIHAKTPIQLKCGYVIDMMKYSMQGLGTDVTSFSLKKEKETNVILFASVPDPNIKMNDKGLFAPWRILVRQGNTLDYCLVGAGERMEALGSAEYANPKNKYGIPGSGYPRCSVGKDIISAIDVQLWANKELGKSAIFHFSADVGNKDFTLIMSQDQEKSWIILDSNVNDVTETCYYSRGSNSIEYSHFKI